MRKVALHLGAHKTGSSYLQNTFDANAASLQEAGVGYVPLKELRKTFTERFIWKPKAGDSNELLPGSVQSALHQRVALISDENILGRLYNFKEGLPYPEAPANLARAVALLASGDAAVTVFLSIRNYADWLESVYLQALRAKVVLPFSVFCKRIDLELISWEKMLAGLLEAMPGCSFVVWPYEHFLSGNDPVIDHLARFLEADLSSRPETPANLSYSAVAYSILLGAKRSRAEIQPEHWEKLHRFVRSAFSIAQGYEKPKLFSKTRRENLASRYDSDLKKIRSMAGGRLELLGFDEF